MAINLNPVSAVIDAAAKGVKTVGGVFSSNKENDAQRSSDEQMAVMQSYQAEFNQRQNRTKIDALADAFNRLVRPTIVSLVIFIFIIAYVSPKRLYDISTALALIPQGYWTLLSVIVAFYFGGRMQLKSQDFEFNETQAKAVKSLMETKAEFRKLEMDTDEPDRLAGNDVGKAAVNDSDRALQTNDVVTVFSGADNSNNEELLHQEIARLKDEPIDELLKRRKVGRGVKRPPR